MKEFGQNVLGALKLKSELWLLQYDTVADVGAGAGYKQFRLQYRRDGKTHFC